MIDNTKIKTEMSKYKQVQGLMHYFTLNNLKEAHKNLDGNKALGVDKISKKEYNSNLEENLNNLEQVLENTIKNISNLKSGLIKQNFSNGLNKLLNEILKIEKR